MSRIADATQYLTEANSLQTLRLRTLRILPTLVPSSLTAWTELDRSGIYLETVIGLDTRIRGDIAHRRQLKQAFIDHLDDHPVLAHYRHTTDGRPYAISDFLSAEQFHATGIYQHVYRHLGAEDQLSFAIPHPHLVVGIALSRDDVGFSERERGICTLLRPILVQAYRNLETVARVQRLLSAVDQLAQRPGEGIILLDRRGTIDYLSPGVQDLMRRYFDHADPSTLPDELTSWIETNRDATPARPLLVRHDRHQLLVRQVCVADGAALSMTESLRDHPALDLGRLGLTARETKMMGFVGDSLSSKDIAALLAISSRTVEKHIDNALRKIGVRNRLSAVKVISQIAAAPAIGSQH